MQQGLIKYRALLSAALHIVWPTQLMLPHSLQGRPSLLVRDPEVSKHWDEAVAWTGKVSAPMRVDCSVDRQKTLSFRTPRA